MGLSNPFFAPIDSVSNSANPNVGSKEFVGDATEQKPLSQTGIPPDAGSGVVKLH